MNVIQYLDAAKKALGCESDYQLAKVLKCKPSRISNYRTGRNVPDDWIASRIAMALNVNPMKVILDFRVERAERAGRPAEVKKWRGWLKDVAACVLVAVGASGAPSPAPAQGANPAPQYYVKRRRGPGGGSGLARMALQLLGLHRQGSLTA